MLNTFFFPKTQPLKRVLILTNNTTCYTYIIIMVICTCQVVKSTHLAQPLQHTPIYLVSADKTRSRIASLFTRKFNDFVSYVVRVISCKVTVYVI